MSAPKHNGPGLPLPNDVSGETNIQNEMIPLAPANFDSGSNPERNIPLGRSYSKKKRSRTIQQKIRHQHKRIQIWRRTADIFCRQRGKEKQDPRWRKPFHVATLTQHNRNHKCSIKSMGMAI